MEEKDQKRKDKSSEQQKVNKTWLAFGKLKGALTILDPNLLLRHSILVHPTVLPIYETMTYSPSLLPAHLPFLMKP